MRMRWKKIRETSRSPQWAAVLPYLWVVCFFLVPFLIVLKISFSDFRIGLPPYGPMLDWVDEGVLNIRLNFTNYALIISDDLYISSYLDSLYIAFLGTLGCLIVGYPVAYGIAKSLKPLRTVLLMLVILPFWTSFLLRVYAWIGILSPTGLINHFLIKWGIVNTPLPLIDNTFATVLGIVYSYLPFMILPLYASLEKIDPSLTEAGYDLGARPWRIFTHVILPLSLPGIITGSMLVFIPAVGEFIIPELLGGPETFMIGKLLWNEFFTNRDWPVASALAIAMLLLLVLPIFIFQRLQAHIVSDDDEA